MPSCVLHSKTIYFVITLICGKYDWSPMSVSRIGGELCLDRNLDLLVFVALPPQLSLFSEVRWCGNVCGFPGSAPSQRLQPTQFSLSQHARRLAGILKIVGVIPLNQQNNNH